MVHRPLRLRLDGDALVSNWRWLRARGGSAACGAAVKANGYGLGAREVVERLAAAGCRDFFVSTWSEAEALMPWPKGLNLSVLHGVGADDLPAALGLPARPVLNTALQVARWRESGEGSPCDVMIDTGMNRLGLSPAEARSGMLDGLAVETLMSHLACADEPGHSLTSTQLSAFRALRDALSARRYSLANSAGICLGEDYAFDLTRPGIALYGGRPMPDDPEQARHLRPVVTMEAQVLQLRSVEAGATVGYNATYTARAQHDIAILNIGYADGILRQMDCIAVNHPEAPEDNPLPLVGRISMDLIAVRVPPQLSVAEGDWLTIHLDLPAIAARTSLGQYEILTGLDSRFERRWN
jgi:alanine racemase